jgi:multidrug resistance efflux pump
MANYHSRQAGLTMRRFAPTLALALACACSGVEADRPRAEGSRTGDARRGDFERHLLLSGVLEAVRSTQLTAPNVPTNELHIRWIEEDGAFVRAGQKVLEFDNDAFASVIEDLKLNRRKEEKELARFLAQIRAEEAEKAFQVQAKEIEVEKAALKADVPPEILPLREFEERQLALERARIELEKARSDLDAHRRTQAEETRLKELSLEKTIYAIETAEAAIDALALRSPTDGVLVIATIPWEGRKVAVGDNVWPGFPLLELPDLSEMRVRALLSDVDDGRLAPGMKARVALDAYPEVEFDAEVSSITPVAQETSPRALRRAFTVNVRLERTDPERMRPGMAAKVRVTMESRRDVLLVPRSAVDFSATPNPICGLFECLVEEAGK